MQKIKQLYQAAREREAGKRVAALMLAETPKGQQSQNRVIFLERFFDALRRKLPSRTK